MSRIALHAKRHDHHPEWSKVYKRVGVSVTSHEVSRLSIRDIARARRADRVEVEVGGTPAGGTQA